MTMHSIAEQYYHNLLTLIPSVEVTDDEGKTLGFYAGIDHASEFIMERAASKHKMMFIGNGASAAISSHMAADYSKNGSIRAMAFNDIALLTAVSNDFGYRYVFEKPIKMFAEQDDILFAISSSGRSENILKGVQAARDMRCSVITLSGFNANNPLRKLGDINFYVPWPHYGPVEVLHHSICHGILDVIMAKRNA